MRNVERLCLAHFWVAFAAFLAAAVLGTWQMWVRSPLGAHVGTPGQYFMSVTAHGVAMAYVLTTFFIMGFGYFVAVTSLDRPLPGKAWAWARLLDGDHRRRDGGDYRSRRAGPRSSSLSIRRSRQAPGSISAWFWSWSRPGSGALLMIVAMRDWKRENPGKPVPLAMFATVANAVMWLWTTVGVAVELLFQVIPAAFGLVQTIDAGLARTLFSWTLHAIVYFWLIPAYIAFYTMVPRAAGGRLYSDTMGRLTFILFLVYSLPVGMHHLMMDPEHGNGTKFIQVLLTAFVSVPTLLTIFTITASLEIAGRLRGGRGVFGWIAALPWERPMVLATGLAFVMLGFGGFGGLINMGYGMNAMIHNTSWVTAHFHLIFGGSVVIMYFAIAYEIWPRLTGREYASLAPLRLQLWLWFIGMMVMTLPWHWLGLQGQWRRVANFNYADPIIAGWGPLVIVSFVGGLVLLVSALLFLRNLWCCTGAHFGRGPAALCARRASAAARARRAQRLRAVERAGPRPDAARLWLSDRAVRDRAVAERDGSPDALGHSMAETSEPHVLDQPWRIWASVAVICIVLAGVLLGVLIIPVVQGSSAGIDAYTAICRALGILPGSPARQQVADRTRRRRFRKWYGHRTSCKFWRTPSPNAAAPKSWRSAPPAMAKRAFQSARESTSRGAIRRGHLQATA